jgi:hypothetical protein
MEELITQATHTEQYTALKIVETLTMVKLVAA